MRFIIIMISIVFSASTALALSSSSDYSLYLKFGDRDPKWNEYIEPAFTSFDSGNLATAGVFLTKAYEKGCRDPLILFRLGIYKESRGQFQDAAMILAEAADKFEKHYHGHPLKGSIAKSAGRTLYQIDEYDRALPYLEKALQAEPDDFMVLLMLGQIKRKNKQYEDAKIMFERALAAKKPEGVTPDPRRTVLNELVILTFELKDMDACRQYVNQVLSVWPQDPVANSYRSKIERAHYKKHEQEMINKIIK